jgi:hypothetical protein
MKMIKFLTYTLNGNPTGSSGWGVAPTVGTVFAQVRVRAVVQDPLLRSHVNVDFVALPKS